VNTTWNGSLSSLSSHDAFLYERDVHWWKKDCLDSKEIHGLQIQMDVLKEQNRKLTEKVQDLSNKAMD
jgi:hypothetical protein